MPRPNAPWWRTDRRQWFATIRGRKTPLGIFNQNDVAGALEALRIALGGAKCPPASPAPGEAPPADRRTVADLVPVYEAEVVSQVAPVTRASYASRLRWLRREFGDRDPAGVEPGEVERAVKAAGWANNTRRHFLLVLQHFFKWAGRKDFFVRKPPPESRGDDTLVRPEQLSDLLKFARGDFGPYLRFLWLTGCRPGEACSLTVDQVDWQGGTCVLRQHKTAHKGRRRVIYLSPEALSLLTAQRGRHGTGHLFRRRENRPFTPVNVADRFRRCARLAGVPRSAYSLRHSYITRMLEAGATDSDVAALVGHAGTKVIHSTYSHLTANARRLRDVAGRGDGIG
jgi:integrase